MKETSIHLKIGNIMKKDTCEFAKNHLQKNIESLLNIKDFCFEKEMEVFEAEKSVFPGRVPP